MNFNKIIFTVVLLLASAPLFAQRSTGYKKDAVYQSHPATNLNWEGTYFGVTNCANCDGIETKLVLQKGNKFILSTKATHTPEKAFTQKGTFKWQGDIIILLGITVHEVAEAYKVEENQVKQLYRIDNELQGENWSGYTLKKVANTIVEGKR